MKAEIGSRSVQDLIDGVARRALKEARHDVEALAPAKESADALAVANKQFIGQQMIEQNMHARPEDRLSPAELARRVNDVPVNSKFFRRMAGLRNGDLKG